MPSYRKPVPPRSGYLNVLFGPHCFSGFSISTFRSSCSTSTTDTRSPIHTKFMSSAGVAQTLKLYGTMKCSAMPVPMVAWIHSAKFAGRRSVPVAFATAAFVAASTAPARHSAPARSGQALERRLRGEAADVVLEGVGDEAILHPHPRLAVQRRVRIAHEP